MNSGVKLGRANVSVWMATVLFLMVMAAPCTAGRKKTPLRARRQAKKASHRAAGGKKPLKAATGRPVRWHPGVALAYRMQGPRDKKR